MDSVCNQSNKFHEMIVYIYGINWKSSEWLKTVKHRGV